MKKIFIAQSLSIIVFILSMVLFLIEGLKNMSFYGSSSTSFLEIFFGGSAALSVLIFIILYIIKTITERKFKKRILLMFIPVIGTIFSIIYVNGIFLFADANSINFSFIDIFSILFQLIMIILYNAFVLLYCDNNIRPYFGTIMYNLLVVITSIKGAGIEYINHYYLGYLILFMPVIIIEYFIKKNKKK